MWSRLNFLGRPFKVLAIETSCDDTCVAILDSAKNILAETTIKQHKIHEQFKGIVPHLASRAHKINLPRALEKTFNSANLRLSNIDAIAVTRGPGIGGCLTIGYQCGLNLAAASDIPFIPVNHMVPI